MNLLCVACEAVPQHEADDSGHQCIDEHAQPLHGKTGFVIPVHQCADDEEKDEDFIEVGNRDMAGIAQQQVAFVPANQEASKARQGGDPTEGGTHAEQGIGLAFFVCSQQGAAGVGEQGGKNHRALPHNRRLAAEEVAQEEFIAVAEVSCIEGYAAVGQCQRERDEPAHGFEKPAQADGADCARPQDNDFVYIHSVRQGVLHEGGNERDKGGKQPVFGIQRVPKRTFCQEFVLW